jgi:hypothetical protein
MGREEVEAMSSVRVAFVSNLVWDFRRQSTFPVSVGSTKMTPCINGDLSSISISD